MEPVYTDVATGARGNAVSDTTAGKVAAATADSETEHTEKLSSLLRRLADEADERVSLREISAALDERSFGAFLLVFAIPNLLPWPPGATLILGVPLLIISWQIIAGRNKIWLPRRIADFSIEKKTFYKVVDKMDSSLRWIEDWVRPRNWPLRGRRSERLYGLYIMALAIVVLIPIPFCNWLPAFAIAIIGVAHTEQDGNCLALGSVIGIVAIAILVLITTLTSLVFASFL